MIVDQDAVDKGIELGDRDTNDIDQERPDHPAAVGA